MAETSATNRLTADALLALGFVDIGCWAGSSDGANIDYRIDVANPNVANVLLDSANSLYAFIDDSAVLYIGKTARTVRGRLSGYRRPHRQQRTNWRCNERLREMLKSGRSVRILAFNPISHLHYDEFEINLAAGLEDSLIARFDPPWNGRAFGHAITEEAEREEQEAAPGQDDVLAVHKHHREPATEAAPPVGAASFPIVLGEAYYNHGIINPGVAASRQLGEHGQPIAVKFGDGSTTITSTINRTANSNGSVRVVGRNRQIARWFQDHFRQGETVDARVLDRNSILLLPKTAPR